MSTIGELYDSLEPGASVRIPHGGAVWEITRVPQLPEYEPRPTCECCGEYCDYPPVCPDCDADAEAAKAYREGRDE